MSLVAVECSSLVCYVCLSLVAVECLFVCSLVFHLWSQDWVVADSRRAHDYNQLRPATKLAVLLHVVVHLVILFSIVASLLHICCFRFVAVFVFSLSSGCCCTAGVVVLCCCFRFVVARQVFDNGVELWVGGQLAFAALCESPADAVPPARGFPIQAP